MFYRTYRYRYSSVHRLHSQYLNEAENRALYGKCNNPNGHGHTYEVIVTLKARTLPAHGEVFPRYQMDEIMARLIAPRFAGQDVNVTFGPGFISSGERLVEETHALLRQELGELVHSVGLTETPKNSFAC